MAVPGRISAEPGGPAESRRDHVGKYTGRRQGTLTLFGGGDQGCFAAAESIFKVIAEHIRPISPASFGGMPFPLALPEDSVTLDALQAARGQSNARFFHPEHYLSIRGKSFVPASPQW
jgi:hypothetical protein